MRNGTGAEPSAIWWEQVSGPSAFLREAAETIRDGKHLCLIDPDSLPWSEPFFEKLKETVRDFNDALTFEYPDETSETPETTLLEHFGLAATYRPTKSYCEFLRQSGALTDRVVCAAARTKSAADAWLAFAKEYKPQKKRDGVLLIKTRRAPSGGVPKHIRALSCDAYASEYDAQVFAGLASPRRETSVERKRYVTALAVSLFGANAEEIARFVDTFRVETDDPETTELPSPVPERARRIWNAQVQTLFPLVMRETREIIDARREQIDEAFAYADAELPRGLLDSNQERIPSPDEITEIGTVRFLTRLRRRDSFGELTAEYALYIRDEAVRDRIERLYVMRNRIAHGKICPPEDVRDLLSV